MEPEGSIPCSQEPSTTKNYIYPDCIVWKAGGLSKIGKRGLGTEFGEWEAEAFWMTSTSKA
jgi:hypothetical protein